MLRKVTGLAVTEKTVCETNADQNRLSIDTIVIHTMVGTATSADYRFNDCSSKVSAHYGILETGEIWHWVDEDWVAYHAGAYNINQRSIGIEHEDYGNYNAPRPDTLYASSSQLVADICRFYNIPVDRQHILKHSEIVATNCPDSLDVNRIVNSAAQILAGGAGGGGVSGMNNISLDQDHLNALQDLENYRRVRQQGSGGNFQGFVDAIIGSDRDLPTINQQLLNYQNQAAQPVVNFPVNTINTPNTANGVMGILTSIWNWLRGKKTYLVSGLIIGLSQLKAMGIIDTSTYQVGISILGALGLAAIRMGMSGQ